MLYHAVTWYTLNGGIESKGDAMETLVDIDQRWFTVAEVAERLRVNRRTIIRHIEKGELRAVKLPQPAGWRISEADLGAWLASRANRPPTRGTP